MGRVERASSAVLVMVLSASGTQAAGQSQQADIVVTAQRRTEAASTVPITMTVISGDKATDRQIESLADLARYVPGFSASDSGQNVPIFTLRGVGVNETSLAANPAIALHVDDVPLPYATMARGAALDLARIEVLKGPQGTQYGANSTGGAINFISVAPDAGSPAYARTSVGRFNTVDVEGAIGGVVDGISARIAAKTTQGGDWQRSTSREAKLGERHKTDVRAQLGVEPTDRLHLVIAVNGWRDRSDTQALQLQQVLFSSPGNAFRLPTGLRALQSRQPPTNNRDADWDSDQDYARDDGFTQVSARLAYDLSPQITAKSITAYSVFRTEAFQDRDGTPFQNSANDFSGRIRSFFQELRFVGAAKSLQWTAGANYRRDRLIDTYRNLIDAASGSFIGPLHYPVQITDARTRVEAVGAYGNADLSVTSNVSLGAGARYSRDTRSLAQCGRVGPTPPGQGFELVLNALRARAGFPPLGPITAGSCVSVDANLNPELYRGRLREDNISWRGVMSFRPGRDQLLYASVSRGYKAGSFPTVAATASAQFAPARQESLLAVEAGVKSTVIPNRLRMNAAAFSYRYDDKQVRGRFRDPFFGVIALLVNVPRSDVHGIEAEVTATPFKGLSITGTGAYTQSRVRRYTGFDLNGVQRDFAGSRLPYAPRWSFNVNPNYVVAVNDRVNVVLDAEAAYRSGSSAFFGSDASVALPAYATLDLQVKLADHATGWSYALWGRNVTDSHYWSNVARGLDTYTRVSAFPATFGIAVAVKG